ncbi:MarR family winged helix-turn-helix transcriptional regulator [Massilia sp. TS11]|uniref:MarR family winged helix-turn-helix transcriptional regulator n=1 Tax=Massilia sp. TS11 TaxID=2908003 RepID=UPI001EDBF7E5|nr:MarR family transcriptional regulator [Massilia sp. TS11]MCG2586388.1 MarR family transcriptional regulator [Massilia sp. TS11]
MKTDRPSFGFLLSNVARLMRGAFERELEGSKLTLAQARALVYVSRNEGVRQVALAELLEVQPMTLARLLDQLAAAGLIERRADPADRRAFRIFLTRAADPSLDIIARASAAIHARALDGLSGADAQALMRALETVHSNLSLP